MTTQRQSQADRLARLQRILSAVLAEQRFTLQQVRQLLPTESPRMISRLVRDLESEGHVQEAEDEAFCWTCNTQDFPAQCWLEKKVYTTQLLETPAADRPRERLLTHGAAALRTAELLTILTRTGRP